LFQQLGNIQEASFINQDTRNSGQCSRASTIMTEYIRKLKLCFYLQTPHVIQAYGSASHSHLQTGLFEYNQPGYLRILQEICT